MTLHEIVDRVREHMNLATGEYTSAQYLRVQGHVNQWHRRILSLGGFDVFRRGTWSVASTASDPLLAMPSSVGRVLRIHDAANRVTLEERFWDWYQWVQPNASANLGLPRIWVLGGPVACAALGASSAGIGLWAESTSNSDTCHLYIEGVRAYGNVWSDTVTLTGTTRVAVGLLTDWTTVTKVELDAAAIGQVSLFTVAAAGTAKAVIPIGNRRVSYLAVNLWPTPSASVTYTVEYERQLLDMTDAADCPLLPEDYHWLLEKAAIAEEYQRTSDDREQAQRADVQRGIGELRARLHQRIDIPVPGRPAVTRISRINGWSPADTVILR